MHQLSEKKDVQRVIHMYKVLEYYFTEYGPKWMMHVVNWTVHLLRTTVFHRIQNLSRATEFACFRGISVFSRNFCRIWYWW